MIVRDTSLRGHFYRILAEQIVCVKAVWRVFFVDAAAHRLETFILGSFEKIEGNIVRNILKIVRKKSFNRIKNMSSCKYVVFGAASSGAFVPR